MLVDHPLLVLALLGIATTLPVVAFAAWLWRLGSRAIAARQFPPPGVITIGRREPLRGDDAVSRGTLAKAFAAVLAMLAIVTAIWFVRFARLIGV